MEIGLSANLLSDSGAPISAITGLIDYLIEARGLSAHLILAAADLNHLLQSVLERLPQDVDYYLYVEQLATSAAYAPEPEVVVDAENLGEAVRELHRGGCLIVEDITSDVAMIGAFAKALSTDVHDALTAGSLDVSHGGGSRIFDVVVAALRGRGLFRRVVVLVDSDRLVPGEDSSHDDMAESLRAMGARVWMSSSRELENYIPTTCVAAKKPSGMRYGEWSRKVASFQAFSPEQRAHYDMKYGFKSVLTSEPKHRALFASFPAEHILRLSDGFGKDMWTSVELRPPLHADDFRGIGEYALADLNNALGLIEGLL